MFTAMSGISSETLQIRRSGREIDAIVRRIRRGHADARLDFRSKPLSRRKRVAERRKDLRQPLHVPVYLTPCRVQGTTATCVGETIMGVTRDISDQGVGFGFDLPLNTSHVLAEFDIYGRGPVIMLVEVRWTEKKAPHAFVAGGLWRGVARLPDGDSDLLSDLDDDPLHD